MKSWNENMKIWAYVIIAVSMVPVIWLLIAGLTSRRRVNPDWLSRDLQTVESLVFQHVDPFWKNKKEDFTELFKRAEESMKWMHRMDFYLLIQPMFALLEDHESKVIFGMPYYMPVLPFKVLIREGRMFAYDSVDPDVPNGGEITSFNGMKTSDFLKYIREFVGGETEAYWEKGAEDFVFKMPSIYRQEFFDLVVDGKKVRVRCMSIKEYREKRREMYGKEKDFDYTERGDVGILKLKTMGLWGQDIQDFEDLVDEIASKDLKALVVDLRGNTGGSMKTVETLVSRLVGDAHLERIVVTGDSTQSADVEVLRADEVFKGDLYVLVDRYTLDEAYDAALMLSKRAKIIGERPDMNGWRFYSPLYKRLPSVGMYAAVSQAKLVYHRSLRIDEEHDETPEEYAGRIALGKDELLEKLLEEIK